MSTEESEAPRHPIGVVARRTGLKQDLIRAWERRYGAVRPRRHAGRHRYYTDADIERLTLLRRATDGGHSIGHIAKLSEDALRALTGALEPTAAALQEPPPAAAPPEISRLLEECLAAVRSLDGDRLELILERAAIAMHRALLFTDLLEPLLQEIGRRWDRGELRPLHEHLATSVVRSFVGGLRNAGQTAAHAPHFMSTTPAGQLHEMGALLASGLATLEGWNVTYLGPDLPAEEILAATQVKPVRVLALSITYPPDDPNLRSDLRRICRHLAPEATLIVGGRSAGAYLDGLGQREIHEVHRLQDLRGVLRQLRTRGPSAATAAPQSFG